MVFGEARVAAQFPQDFAEGRIADGIGKLLKADINNFKPLIEGILRASSGAAYELNVVRLADGLGALNELKQAGFEICAASADGENFKELKFAKKRALVMGNEGFGIPAKVLKKCDKKVSIKMREGWDSLNVSAAFAILCDRILNG